jgi:hypothetical protein
MAEVYRIFAKEYCELTEIVPDFSPEVAEAMYLLETFGKGSLRNLIQKDNGYAIGKFWKDWQVSEWRTDGWFTGQDWRELFNNGEYPGWWLKKICPKGILTSITKEEK